MERLVAIITARGGSKRIPRKNIKQFCGRPIIEYSIEAALESRIFDEVMVSTDDEEIMEIARKEGASVPFLRSKTMANDYATTTDVLKEVILEYEKRKIGFDMGCCIYPTAPFVTGDKLRDAMGLLKETDADSVMPVVQYSFPPQRGVEVKDGYVRIKYPEQYMMRSQDLDPVYHDAGQFYCFHIKRFLETEKLVGEKCISVIVPDTEVQDIDNEEDWVIAEMKYKLMRSKMIRED